MSATTLLWMAAALPLVIWIYLLAARGSFWRASRLTLSAQRPSSEHARVAVVIPARNEAQTVGKCIASLLLQQDGDLHIYLVDDGSSDGTADVARAAARELQREHDVTILAGTPPPAGWTGKLWAMQQGIERARPFTPEFVLLTDADIGHAPGALAELVSVARRGKYDLTSLMVRLACESAAERWLMPAFVFFFFMLYPPRWVAEQRSRTAAAAGGCMLVRSTMLDEIDGVRQIRGAIIDDCALAALIKHHGGRLWLGLANETASLRPYVTAKQIGGMIARSAFSQLRHSAPLLILALLGLIATFVLPMALLFTGDWVAAGLGLSAWLLMSVCYLPMVRYYRLAPAWVLVLPAAAVFYMGATLVSAVRYWAGRGGQWKGRVQDVASR